MYIFRAACLRAEPPRAYLLTQVLPSFLICAMTCNPMHASKFTGSVASRLVRAVSACILEDRWTDYLGTLGVIKVKRGELVDEGRERQGRAAIFVIQHRHRHTLGDGVCITALLSTAKNAPMCVHDLSIDAHAFTHDTANKVCAPPSCP